MRLFVTGAGGFLGRHLAAAAKERGHEVVGLTRRPSSLLDELGVETIVADLAALEDLPARIDAVVHFATGTEGDDAQVLEVAVGGTRRVAELACAAAVPRFMHISSMSVYPGPVRGQALEPHPDRRGLYARSKTLAERELQELARRGLFDGTELIVLRPGLVFGSGMKSVLAGTAVELPLGLRLGLGRRRQSVPFVELGDLVIGTLSLLDHPPNPGSVRVYDVLSGKPPSKEELIRVYEELTGQDGRTVWAPLPAARFAGAVVDRLRPTELAYNVERMYRFEAGDLPHAEFWQAAGRAPQGSVRSAIAAALTVERENVARDSSDEPRSTAGEICRVANGVAPTDVDPVPLVLVGAGRIVSEMHVPALLALPQFQVRAVIDPDRSLALAVAKEFPGATTCARIEEAGDDVFSGATAVVAAPGFLHASLSVELLERGAALLLEKPAVLLRPELEEVARLATDLDRPVTVIQNYRLRPRVRDLWRFLLTHEVGAPLAATLVFHAPRIDLERARWMHEEKRSRALIMEMAVHFLDLITLVCGGFTDLDHVALVDSADRRRTVSLTGLAATERGAEVVLDLDLSGTAPRTRLELEFERAVCVLDFYPDGFRVLPRKANPLGDLAANTRRFANAVHQQARPLEGGLLKRAIPHHRIYLEHFARVRGRAAAGAFSLDAVAGTMESLFLVADAVYAESGSAVGAA